MGFNFACKGLMKIRCLGAEFYRVDGQADTTKPIVAFRNFANAPQWTD